MPKIFGQFNKSAYLCIANEKNINAKIAQLVEHDLAKVGVAGSSPVFRSKLLASLTKHLFKASICPGGGIGRHATLRG